MVNLLFFFLTSLTSLLIKFTSFFFFFLFFFLGGDIFLKGQYIEVGIHYAGSYGTLTGAPVNYVSFGNQLGFIADYDKNGFYPASGPGYAGDYFIPGNPLEGNHYYYHLFTFPLFLNTTNYIRMDYSME